MAIHTPEMTATETVPADAEIAVTGPADAAPVTASDGSDAAAPDADTPDTTNGTDARVEAVLAALESLPGGSATGLGAAAGLSRVAAGKLLNQMEADGLVRREAGVNDGTTRGRAADRWYPITPDAVTTTATDADAEPTDTTNAPAPAPETPDAAPEAIAAPDTDEDTPDVDTVPAPEAGAAPAAIDSPDPIPADEPTGEEDLIDDEEADGQDSDGTDGDLNAATDTDPSEPLSEPVADDPEWARAHAELTELTDLFSGVLSAKEEGNTVMALGCLEMAMTKVASAHRTARAALTGTTTPARAASVAHPGAGGGAGLGGSVRPGGLRDLIHAHLVEFPGKEFTPHDMAKALGGRSSGAVANALDRLVQLGDAVLTTERPRRFSLAPTATPPNAPTGIPAAPADAPAEDGAATDGY